MRGFSPLRAGLTLLPMPVMMAISSPISGRILARGGPRVPFVIAGAALTLSTAALSQLSPTSGPLFLIVTYGLFGLGAGMVNVPISNGVMSGVPRSQAGVASGMNSSSRQLGQSLGVAIVGSVLAASLRGSMHAGFLTAAHAGWWIMAGCGYAVLVLGVISTTGWARATADRTTAAVTADQASPTQPSPWPPSSTDNSNKRAAPSPPPLRAAPARTATALRAASRRAPAQRTDNSKKRTMITETFDPDGNSRTLCGAEVPL